MPITYKCPSCGSAMEFDGNTQMLSCMHCGNNITVEDYQKVNESSQQQKGDSDKDNFANSEKKLKVYHCQSCGAELVTDEYTSATTCSFCGNPSLVEDRLSGDFSPSTVIPFKMNKERAKESYLHWVKKGPLTPRTLSAQSTIEKITGMYVPFWLYNFSATDHMQAAATRVRSQRQGEYQYTYTDHYQIDREVAAEFERIPTDASEKMPDDAMDKLEPFDYGELRPFEMPYLSGYLSERYNYTQEQLIVRAKERAEEYITGIARGTIAGYATVSVISNQAVIHNTSSEYALFPVWMLNYRYKGKNYQFMLNGQTGKIVADRPISIQRAFAWGAAIFMGTFIITMIGGLFL